MVLIGVCLPGMLQDLQVYRVGGSAWLHGIPLYEAEFPSGLPFTYPPAAAIMFTALSAVSWPIAIAATTLAGLIALSVVTVLATPAPTARSAVPLATAVVALGLAVEPVRSTLMFGQINLVLMGLVALDCLLPSPPYPRGLLIGLATALKLTPAIFIVFFLVRRQFSPVMTAATTFGTATWIVTLIVPDDSITYWTNTVFDADRVGGLAFATNQSLLGALHRLDLPPAMENVSWVALVGAVAVLAWLGARRARQAGDQVVALLVAAAAGLLVSPVSWSHHWVWITPAIVVGVHRTFRSDRRRPFAAVVVTAAVFTIGPGILPHGNNRELAWTWWQQLAGDSYLFTALLFLVWNAFAAHAPRSRPSSREPAQPRETTGAPTSGSR
jgi:alpha-1,2-mannosyltransferase